MKNRFSGKLKNTIELTSLLDVIFIVLMIVICNQQINMTAKEESAKIAVEEAADMQAEARAEKELYEQHRDTYAEINEQMEIITVYVDYKPSDIKNREIRIMANDEELPRITVSPSNSGDAYRQFENALESRIKNAEDAGKPAIISIDTTQILYRDERAVQEIIDGLFDRHDNLFSKKIK
ncbi:MAG: hypothetical protein KBS51_01225 [Lachnospiraceae bacterium]|nr:hypothetical protein [Candidatus Darwinimomas equi]